MKIFESYLVVAVDFAFKSEGSQEVIDSLQIEQRAFPFRQIGAAWSEQSWVGLQEW